MLKSLIFSAAAIVLTPMISAADTAPDYTAQEIELIEDALDNLVVPARVEVGVGIDADDRPNRPVRSRVMCRAQAWNGRTYDAVGYDRYRVEQRAYNQCARQAMRCRAVGCRTIR